MMQEPMTYQPVIEIEGVTKRFPKTSGYRDMLRFWRRRYVTALERIDLEIQPGKVFGILGPNGAGKTTLLKILAGLVLPDNGAVRIDGFDVTKDPDDVKEYLTYISGDERTLYWRLTGRQNLQFFAMLNEIPKRQRQNRIYEVLSLVGLEESADDRVAGYSSGMKQRLVIARGLLSEPDILLLDEPTRSLDPLSARQLQNFIRDELIGRQGKTIIIATHNMEEASFLCDQVAILYEGSVRACDSVDSIAERLAGQGRCVVTVAAEANGLVRDLSALPGVVSVQERPANGHGGTSLSLMVGDPLEHIPLVTEYLVRNGSKVLGISQVKPSLTDAIAAMAEEARGHSD